jgi:hypothetical protein
MTKISNKVRSYAETRFLNSIDGITEIEEMVGKIEEVSNTMPTALTIGFEQGAFFAGFVNPLKQLGFTEEMLTNVIVAKMTLEYQTEMSRMRFETEERIAEMYSSAQISMGYNPED